VIVSHWRDNVCVATTPVGVNEIAALVGLLVGALHDAAAGVPAFEEPGDQAGRRRLWRFVIWGRYRLNALLGAVARHRRHHHIAEEGQTQQVA
jgi:hypothetical protein